MVNIALQSLSKEMNISIFKLIQYFSNIGIIKNQNDYITSYEKTLLLHYLSSRNSLSVNQMNKKKNMNNITNNMLIQNIKNTSTTITMNNKKFNKNVVIIKDSYIKKQPIHTIHEIKNNIVEKHFFKNINNVTKTTMNKKNNSFAKPLDSINKNKDISKKKTYHIKKEVNISKKNKLISSDKSILQNISSHHHIKKIINVHKIKHNELDEELFLQNKKIQKKIKKHDISDNNMYITKIKKENLLKYQESKMNKKHFLSKDSHMKPINNVRKNIIIHNKITIFELANKMAIKGSKIIKKIMKMGSKVTINQSIDQETAQLIVEEMGYNAILRDSNTFEKSILDACYKQNKKYKKVIRPPIVTIMGHVDHGKTSLLDYIRSTRVVSKEHGGITQHIGAYHIETKHGIITFLDTPGHSAFTSMRARGAQITDIVLLVVASDDGVKPQTIEAIQHAQSANVPLLVVINKIDKPESNIEKVKKELLQHKILPEEWGGDTIFINVSAITGQGIKNLLRAILLQAEILELSTINNGNAYGVVVEASLDKYRGPVATILIKEGKLKKGDNILCGLTYGKIRFIKDSFGNTLQYVTPSIPVEILGLSGIPNSGDILYVVKNEKQARQIIFHRKNTSSSNQLEQVNNINVENIFDQFINKKNNELNIILKTDVQGSLEAISNAIIPLSENNIIVKIISANVGEITETDVSLATASNAIIIGFNVRPNVLAKRLIKIENIDVRYYSIIYQLIDDIKKSVSGMHSPICRTAIIGSSEIRNIFKPTKSIIIAGCMVISGVMKRNDKVHIIRNNAVIYTGEIESLRRFKEDIKESGIGKECGIKIKNYNDIRIGDIIESYEMIPVS